MDISEALALTGTVGILVLYVSLVWFGFEKSTYRPTKKEEVRASISGWTAVVVALATVGCFIASIWVQVG